ncbi:MAG: formamidopyrimidine-DNA glycosylase [Phycisphaerae bacterium]|nr:formamidopyrimidine-DNA glycosylase [Gemmatimonadaceae bacterium]
MPELPDIVVYVEALTQRVVGQPIEAIRLLSPFILRSVSPPISTFVGHEIESVERLGKRLIFTVQDAGYLVIHLMIAGRFRWLAKGKKPPGRIALAAFDFPNGTLVLTEAGTARRASLHAVATRSDLTKFNRGGIEPLQISAQEFFDRVHLENHTLKRILTDPRLFSGIGNSYSDEILHRARLSPLMLSKRVTAEQSRTLFEATRAVLNEWTDKLRTETGDGFPEHVTAFREGMAVHGRYQQPCPVCGSPVQRIRYATNETNYCARCQTGGRLLADRAMSRLLKGDWPRSLDELELDQP